jgi:O-methyltransferase domain
VRSGFRPNRSQELKISAYRVLPAKSSLVYTDYPTLAAATGERPALQDCDAPGTPAWMQPRFLSNQRKVHSMDNTSRSTSASQDMLGMITGYWVTQIVRGAAYYSLADHLERQPMTAREFAGAEGLDELATGRFLTACAGLGIAKLEGNRYFTTELLQTLRKGIPGSLSGFALSQAAPGHWLPWGRFTDALKTGERQTLVTLKAEIWDYYESVPDEGAAFTEAMTNLTSTISDAVACLLDTTRFTQAVDVGGAAGAFLYSLMRANAALKGIVFDLPNVVPSASSAANEAGLAKRVRVVGGDFFESVPEGDLYLLKYILHDWGDAGCLTILRNCRRAAKPGARLAVVEQLLEPGTGSPFTPLMDLNMLVMLTGRERTLEEYQRLFSDSGFGQISITRTRSPMMILTAEAV